MGQRAFGQEKLTLNNLHQDDTAIHEWLAYRIFGAVGVPAPRVGYAHVTLDGSDYGTYLLVETLDERDFLARNFPSTFATYEPLAGQDITPENVPKFDVDKGATSIARRCWRSPKGSRARRVAACTTRSRRTSTIPRCYAPWR